MGFSQVLGNFHFSSKTIYLSWKDNLVSSNYLISVYINWESCISTVLEEHGNDEQNKNFLQDKVKPKKNCVKMTGRRPFWLRLHSSSSQQQRKQKQYGNSLFVPLDVWLFELRVKSTKITG